MIEARMNKAEPILSFITPAKHTGHFCFDENIQSFVTLSPSS